MLRKLAGQETGTKGIFQRDIVGTKAEFVQDLRVAAVEGGIKRILYERK
jgi:hypothetical protein